MAQLKGLPADEESQEAIEDWHYWVEQGYELSHTAEDAAGLMSFLRVV